MVTGVKKKFDSGQYRHITLAFVKKKMFFFHFNTLLILSFKLAKKKKKNSIDSG